MRNAVGRVPEVFRTPLLLVAMLGLSCGEVAAILSVPVGTVASRIHRARRRLRGDSGVLHRRALLRPRSARATPSASSPATAPRRRARLGPSSVKEIPWASWS